MVCRELCDLGYGRIAMPGRRYEPAGLTFVCRECVAGESASDTRLGTGATLGVARFT